MKILYLDLETTGTDDNICGIYQLSGIIEINGEVVDTFNFLMNPGDVYVDDWVVNNLKSRGLSLRDLISYRSEDKVFLEFILLIDSYINKYDRSDKFHICGYSIRFDINFLLKWFEKNNNNYYFSYFFTPGIDVMYLASYVLKSIRKKLLDFKLGTLCKVFDIPLDAHDAVEDIQATYHLYKALENYLEINNLH